MSEDLSFESSNRCRELLKRARSLLGEVTGGAGSDGAGHRNLDEVLDERARRLAQEPLDVDSSKDDLEVLVFSLAGEQYAVDSRSVGEVCAPERHTPLPGTPDFVLGLINVRGEILSLLDVRSFFGIPQEPSTLPRPAIVLAGENVRFAILVDELQEVRRLSTADFDAIPPSGNGNGSSFLTGVNPDRVALLDANKLLTDPAVIVDSGWQSPRLGGR